MGRQTPHHPSKACVAVEEAGEGIGKPHLSFVGQMGVLALMAMRQSDKIRHPVAQLSCKSTVKRAMLAVMLRHP